ncbi:MAG: hypothetical protein LUD43_07300 [Firmicutes bacterium]|nr:hypothetical protein [Bacillota bacterium]
MQKTTGTYMKIILCTLVSSAVLLALVVFSVGADYALIFMPSATVSLFALFFSIFTDDIRRERAGTVFALFGVLSFFVAEASFFAYCVYFYLTFGWGPLEIDVLESPMNFIASPASAELISLSALLPIYRFADIGREARAVVCAAAAIISGAAACAALYISPSFGDFIVPALLLLSAAAYIICFNVIKAVRQAPKSSD